MKIQIKEYFENLNPKALGLKKQIKVKSIKKLGMGAGNVNYLVNIDGKKFVFRMNMQSGSKHVSKNEFNGLKAIEKLNIAPKVWLLDTSKKRFDGTFIILSYVDGKLCPHIKSFFTKKVVSDFGELLGRIHNIPIKGNLKKLPKGEGVNGYAGYLNPLEKKYNSYFNKNIKNKEFLEMYKESFRKVKDSLPKKKYKSHLVLSHGDFHEHNIVMNKGEYKLIDFESIGIDDNAIEIAGAFMEFDKLFNSKDRETFLNAYLKITKQNKEELYEKVFTWLPLRYFTDFLWAVRHVYKLKNKEMHSHYVKNADFISHVNYANKTFRICLREKIIDKKYKNLNIKKILSKP